MVLAAPTLRAVTVSGHILTSTSSPAPIATVSFQQLYQLPITTMSAADGSYSLDLAPGCYNMSATSAAYGTILYPGTIRPDLQVGIEIGPTGLTGLVLKYPAGHSMGGTFTASGALPSVLGVALLGEHGELTNVQQYFTTATWGIPYVPDGKWVIAGTDFGYPKMYAPQYYSGADAPGAATVVNLTANLTNINFSLKPIPTISGKVSIPGGGFESGVSVYLYTRGGGSEYTTTDSGGNFTFSGGDLDPGYQGQIATWGSPAHPFVTALGNTTGTFPVSASDWLTASSGPNAVGTIAGQTPGTVKGHVVVAGTTTPIAGITVTTNDPVRLFRLGFNNWNSQPSAADGSYEIDGIQPGHRYTVSPSIPNTPSNYYYDASPLKSFFDLKAEIKLGVDIPLTLGGKIGGEITKLSDSSPVAFATVLIRSDCASGAISYGFTGSDGKFLSPPMPVGTYRYMVTPPASSGLGSIWNGSSATCTAAPGISVAAGATTTSNQALPAASVGPTGHKVTGRLTDAASANGLSSGYVEFYGTNFYFASVDPCGGYEIDGVLDGTYSVFVSSDGYRMLSQSDALVMAGADQVKNFSLTKLAGGITGNVTFDGKPVQGIKVCTTVGNNCAMTDSSGAYAILGLDTGTVNLIALAKDNFDYQFFDGKATLATADAVAVTNGTITTGKDFVMAELPADPGEPDDVGTPGVLSRPESDPGPPRLLPDAPQHRSIKDGEDSDWFQFNVTSGMIYKLTITAGGVTLSSPTVYVFDGTTKLPDAAAGAIVTASGWTATSSGTRWIGLSSGSAGSYTIALTVGAPGPPTPTVTSISPTSGPAAGGTAVTITGTNFAAGATVKFGTVAATNVVFVSATSITCKAPKLPAGLLYDVVVTNTSAKSGTLTKGWLADFLDVAQAYIYHGAIEKVFRAAITSGCGGGNYCPSQLVTRDQMSVFILRGEHGGAYNPPAATGTVFSDVTVSTPFAKWMEQFAKEGISTGCGGGSPPPYCPSQDVTRNAMAKFLLLGKHGSSFNPPAATGTIFADVHTDTTLAKWMEELKTENITGGCQAGVPLPFYCPTGTVTRGEMAKFIRATFGL
ncbi:MAG TPA: IPT/TIG domain-containing protein [Thermoanaerobaculia bacterium]|nr:IPT/TIG domain-containing protein [Thermoanaerobaculia bacterium]